MTPRDKPSDQVREDALNMAKKKLEAGCTPCAESYARLAVNHGATRRHFLKAGIGGLVGAVGLAGALGTNIRPALAAIGPCDYCVYKTVEEGCNGCTYWFITWCIDYEYGLVCEDYYSEIPCSSVCCP